MLYRLEFLNSSMVDEDLWELTPKIGDVLKIGVFGQRYEVQNWTIVEINETTVKVKQ